MKYLGLCKCDQGEGEGGGGENGGHWESLEVIGSLWVILSSKFASLLPA
jgi:hypothetical protein